MKWFKKAVARWAREGNQCEEAESSVYIQSDIVTNQRTPKGIGIGKDYHRSFDAGGMTFTLYKSVGGFVLETHRYDSRTDRRINELYMIDEEKDFATQVAQAIMMESVKL
jgi:hypothetical protein